MLARPLGFCIDAACRQGSQQHQALHHADHNITGLVYGSRTAGPPASSTSLTKGGPLATQALEYETNFAFHGFAFSRGDEF
jgi:hypothetical protein